MPFEIKSIIYCTAIKHGSESDWNLLFERFLSVANISEQYTIFGALGCTDNTKLLDSLLAKSITIEKFNINYIYKVIGGSITVDFLHENWNSIYK
jgi:aminopeptidase N